MRRILTRLAIAAAGVALVVLAALPRAARQTAAPPASTVRGAYHIHSDRSDGSGTLDEIAAAASRAGLQFIILTDHGDGTRQPDPPSYRHGVLTIDAVELSTTGGHYVVLGMPASPYPIAGTPESVIEDVRRFGGFGIAAHPGSPRESLRWTAWEANFDGLEWLNADSEWRDESRLPIIRTLLTYALRPPESMARLLDRPDHVVRRWDGALAARRVTAIAAADAHARLGYDETADPDRSWIHLPLPGYASSFRTFSNHVVLEAPLSGQAAADADRLVRAIQGGRLYTVIDALATPGRLSFTATSGAAAALMGDELPITGDVLLRASAQAPPGTTLVLLKNGQRVHEVTDGILETNGGQDTAAYRVEAYTSDGPGGPSIPWMVSNPIYAGFSRSAPVPAVETPAVYRIPARLGETAAEHGEKDTSRFERPPVIDPRSRRLAGEPPLAWTFELAGGTPAGQFAAIAMPISGGLTDFERVRFTVSSAAPIRAWVQLRAPTGDLDRWGMTFYADHQPRVVELPLRAFRPIGHTSSEQPPLDQITSLLFVVDTLNTRPDTRGSLMISDVAFVR
ncbi:MAG TPA: CehA/McbA family metallohydrolase [Vicinamibacterales bacterium]|nr:CehA/McbA family metallohydrolase [Vicinamibacterales bacterium]